MLVFTSCKKEVATNSTISFNLKASRSAVSGDVINWTSGTASVASTKISAMKSDNYATELRANPAMQVNLFNSTGISNISIVPNMLQQVEFRSELQPMADNASLRLEGTFTTGGVTTPVLFEVYTAVTVKSQKDTIVIAGTPTNYTATTTLSLGALIQTIAESEFKAASRTSGKIIISASSNISIYNKMMANLVKPQAIEFK